MILMKSLYWINNQELFVMLKKLNKIIVFPLFFIYVSQLSLFSYRKLSKLAKVTFKSFFFSKEICWLLVLDKNVKYTKIIKKNKKILSNLNLLPLPRQKQKLTRPGSIRSSPRDGLITPYRLIKEQGTEDDKVFVSDLSIKPSEYCQHPMPSVGLLSGWI